MREKKVRGIKRKSNQMKRRIEEETAEFPTHFYNGYWHLHLPVAQGFIDSNQTPKKVKQLCIQTLINRAEYLIKQKPNTEETYRVVVAVDLPKLWNSQLIVFKGSEHFDGFFSRDSEEQKWLELPPGRNIQTEWALTIPESLFFTGCKEVITDDDYYHEGEIWFIGEII